MGLRRALFIFTILVLAVGLQAQDIHEVTKRFTEYQLKRPEQKLHFTFNQKKYVPGDTVFFKAYLLTKDLQLWKGAQVIELNLLDSEGEVRQHAKIKAQDGVVGNQLVLPNNLREGYYNFTAFTNWMRNFGVEQMFQSTITVVIENQIRPKEPALSFGIEGGNLIDGVVSNVLIKSSTPDAIIYLRDQNGQKLDSAQTDEFGYGRLRLLGDKKVSYSLSDGVGNISLPAVQDFGHNLSVSLPENEFDNVRMLISGKTQPTSTSNEKLSFIITSKGKVVYSEELPANQNKIGRSIGRDRLPSGLYKVSLLDGEGKLLSFREFYLSSVEVKPIELSIDTQTIKPREEVNLEISLNEVEEASGLLLAVTNEQTDPINQFDLEESITLIERVELVGFNDLTSKSEVIDQQLILDPLPPNWDRIMNLGEALPEYGYSTLFQLIGEAIDKSTGQFLPLRSTLMFYLQKDQMRYEIDVLPEGKFVLNLLDVYGEDELFVMAETAEGKEVLDLQINWIEQPLPKFDHAMEHQTTTLNDSYASYSAKRRKVSQSFNYFGTVASIDSLAELEMSGSNGLPMLAVDNSYNVEDFYLFPTFGEFLNEVVRPLRVGQQKGKPFVRVRYLEPNIATADPLYLIDGILTKNTDFLLSLDPKTVKTIEVIKLPRKLARFGAMAKNGIVIVNTKTGNVREPIDPNMKVRGMNRPLSFPALTKSWASNLNDPSFRTTVFWNSDLKFNEEGKAYVSYFTPDDVSPLTIKLEGFVGGRPVSIVKKLPLAKAN